MIKLFTHPKKKYSKLSNYLEICDYWLNYAALCMYWSECVLQSGRDGWCAFHSAIHPSTRPPRPPTLSQRLVARANLSTSARVYVYAILLLPSDKVLRARERNFANSWIL